MRGCSAALAFLVACGVEACAPAPATSSTTTPSETAIVTPNPLTLAPNDCTAPPPSAGSRAHSSALGATVTLPAGWIENPADEGQLGAMAAFALESQTAPHPANIDGESPLPTTMRPHDAVNAEAAYTPGSGTVVAKGDCTIAGSQASFFESSVTFPILFPGLPQLKGAGYVIYIAHRKSLVRLVVVLDAADRESVMPQVKGILGSWQWDQP